MGALLFSTFFAAGVPAVAGPREADCKLSAADAEYLQRALDGWTTVTRHLLRLPAEELPWMVLYSRACAYHLAPDAATPLGRSGHPVASSQLTYDNHPVAIRVLPVTDRVTLPRGDQVPVNGRAFTSVYGDGAAARPFFVTALPDVWAHDPKYVDDPEEWTTFVLEVLSHELVHTRQVVAIRTRLDALRSRFPALPEELDDDWLQERFAATPGIEATVRAEIALLYEAAAAPGVERARSLAATALALVRARRATYYGESVVAYSSLEDVFLNMEGVACWAAFKLALGQAGTSPGATLERFRGNRRWWSQEEGLALFLVLERLVPDWTQRVFPPELASPVDLLEAALTSPAP